MKTPVTRKKILSSNLFPVVGIGASAGGLKAFTLFVKAIPAHSGMAFVLVQHLDPSHKSILPSILQRLTPVPVVEITDDIKVEPDHIYIIPSNKTLIANDGVLELSDRPAKGSTYLPIDLFFTSLAEIHGHHSIGVLLSGNGSDGTRGLTAIKEKGGLCLAQDSESSANDSMPGSAISAGIVHHVMPPGRMPAALARLRPASLQTTGAAAVDNPDCYRQILSLLQVRRGNDFSQYKESTIRRRIGRRMKLHKDSCTRKYLDFLREDLIEQDALLQDLLIPVTSFFRDPKVFDTLLHSLFPLLLKNKRSSGPFRVWVAGCSTGQEAYSIAMLLEELLPAGESFQIFASDISAPAIEKARRAQYSKAEVASVSPERLQRFFTTKGELYHFRKELREKCVFAVHNFLADPPFSKLDFISCRNVLIYMSAQLQEKALTTFHYSLRPGGALLLGKSETIQPASHLFTVAARKDKLFLRNGVQSTFPQASASSNAQHASGNALPDGPPARADFSRVADSLLLSNYVPAGVIINDVFEVLQFRGSTGAFLEQPAGKPNHNLLKMLRHGLTLEMRNLLRKAHDGKAAVKKEHIPFLLAGERRLVTLEAIPLANMVEAYYLVLFLDEGPSEIPKSKRRKGTDATTATEGYIKQLETEVEEHRDNIREIIIHHEELQQELQGANEELVSGNEELQSLNEELETSKEELQSSNEELSSLNEHYNSARQYAEAIVETISEPVIILDKSLRVKSSNTAFCDNFGLPRAETEGRLIYELAQGQWNNPRLRELLEQVLPEAGFSGHEMRFQQRGRERVVRLNALELKQGKDDERLILLAIQDITESTQRLRKKKELLERFQNLVIQAPVAICILQGADHVVEIANDYYLNLVGKNADFLNKPIAESLSDLGQQGILELLDGVYQTGKTYFGHEQPLHLHRNGCRTQCYFNFVYQPIIEPDQTVSGIIVVVAEVTDQVIARKRLESQAKMVRNLIMSAPGFVCTLVGPDHVYGIVNDRYQSLFGNRNIKGKPIMEALPELHGQGFDLILQNVYENGEPYVGIDVPIRLSRDLGLEPELRHFNFSYQPMYDDNHVIFSILVFGYEVTEQIQARDKILALQQEHGFMLEEQVEQRTRELREANLSLQAKNELLLNMNSELESFNYVSSHDLQEPLRKIATYVSRLEQTEAARLSEEGLRHFEKIKESSLRMRTLITDLMSYSMLNVSERKFEDTRLSELYEEVKRDTSSLLHQKGGQLEIIGDSTVPLNRPLMRQVLINLVLNAVKFSCVERPLRVSIATTVLNWTALQDEVPPVFLAAAAHQGSYCRIRVTDNGIGFDNEFRQKIFEIFQRLHSRSEYAGTGIGLAIVKKVVDQHHGFVTAHSAEGEGATFSLYLPVYTVGEHVEQERFSAQP